MPRHRTSADLTTKRTPPTPLNRPSWAMPDEQEVAPEVVQRRLADQGAVLPARGFSDAFSEEFFHA